MRPTITHRNRASEISLAIPNETTEILLVVRPNHVVLYENDELIDILAYPVMRVVRAIRMYCDAKISVR